MIHPGDLYPCDLFDDGWRSPLQPLSEFGSRFYSLTGPQKGHENAELPGKFCFPYPDTQCMVYLPIFTPKITEL